MDYLKECGKTLPDIDTRGVYRYLGKIQERGVSHSFINSNYWGRRLWLEWVREEQKTDNGQEIISEKELDKLQKKYPKRPRNEELKTKALTLEEIKESPGYNSDSSSFFQRINK